MDNDYVADHTDLDNNQGQRLCWLMGRLHRADGTFGHRVKHWYDYAYVLGEYEDVIYKPWSSNPKAGTGEIYISLSGPISESNSDDYIERKFDLEEIYNCAPQSMLNGPWWIEIQRLNQILETHVVAAEMQKEIDDAQEMENFRNAKFKRLNKWAENRRPKHHLLEAGHNMVEYDVVSNVPNNAKSRWRLSGKK